ncbi:MAG: ABC transporter ATP-binding protein [Duodenibacillus sp.]|nr:ABC transporter ATP-binding protein [Duodenibacillus sp.]
MRLEVKDGAYSYSRRGRRILEGVSFAFGERGRAAGPAPVLAVLGPNGAGKTTLLKCMLGLLPWSEGCTLIDGERADQMPARRLWQRVGYVPQAKTPSFATTVLETVVLGRTSHLGELAMPGPGDWERARAALARVGVEHLAHCRCDRISGGEFQLALVARALAGDPELLVLDEPESNLDFRNQRRVLSVIAELARGGIGAVINTHFPAHAIEIATDALVVPRGRTPRFGKAGELLTEDTLTEAFGIQVRIRPVELPEGRRNCVLAV